MSYLNLPPTKSLFNPAAKIPSSYKSSSFFFTMYKVPRERKKERKRPFVNSLRFKPPLKTLFELRKCVFRERRIESREKLFVWLSKTNRKKRVFPQKQSKREEGVGCRSTFSSSRFEKSIHSVKAGGEKELPKRELSTKKKE